MPLGNEDGMEAVMNQQLRYKLSQTLLISVFLLVQITSYALTSGVEIELSLEEKLAASRVEQRDHVTKAKHLLDSNRMDPIFSKALKIVLESNIRTVSKFNLLQAIEKSELDETERKLLNEYLVEVSAQARNFYELTKTAHRSDIEGFNQICSVMIPQMQTLSELEIKLTKGGLFPNPSPAKLIKTN